MKNYLKSTVTMVGVVILVSFILVGLFTSEAPPPRYRELKAISLTFEEETNSSNFLFFGKSRTSEEPVYRFIWKTSEGGWQYKEVAPYRSVVYEDESDNPYVICDGINGPKGDPCRGSYEFHIPPNSIKQIYDVDITGGV